MKRIVLITIRMALYIAPSVTSAATYTPIELTPVIPHYSGTESGIPQHERETFGWNPSYTVNIPAFDSRNRAFFRKRGETDDGYFGDSSSEDISTVDGFEYFDGKSISKTSPFIASAMKLFPTGATFSSIYFPNGNIPSMGVFDSKDRLYTVIRITARLNNKFMTKWILLSSSDFGQTWAQTELASNEYFDGATAANPCPFEIKENSSCAFPNEFDLERPYSAENLSSEPAILLFQYIGQHKVDKTYWNNGDPQPSWIGWYGRVALLITGRDASGNVVVKQKFTVSERAMGIGSHSGSAPRLIRSGNKMFIVWAENTMPPTLADSTKPEFAYSRVMIGEYDISSNAWATAPIEIMQSFPAYDAHNQPGMVRSRDGTLHVISGGHASHFFYTKSNTVDSIGSGWSTPVPINQYETGAEYACTPNDPRYATYPKGGCASYASMMIDPFDVLHLVYRQERVDPARYDAKVYKGGVEYYAYFSSLVSQTMTGGVWSKPSVLVYPNDYIYTIYYHHMAMNKNGNVFVEYTHWRDALPYYDPSTAEVKIPQFRNVALLKSIDQGKTWFLTRDEDFVEDQKWSPSSVFARKAPDGSSSLLFVNRDSRTNLLTYATGDAVDGNLKFKSAERLADGSTIHQYPALLGDRTGDGIQDLLFMYKSSTTGKYTLRWKDGLQNGSFTSIAEMTLNVSDTEFSGTRLLADINGDKRSELILIYRENKVLKIMTLKLNSSNSAYERLSTVSLPDGSVVDSMPVLAGDFNGDKRTDLAFFAPDTTNGKMEIRYRLSNGSGNWSISYRQISSWSSLPSGYNSYVLDADGNGVDDVLFSYMTAQGSASGSLHLATTTILNVGSDTRIMKKDFPDGSIVATMPAATGRFSAQFKKDLLLLPFWDSTTGRLYYRAKEVN